MLEKKIAHVTTNNYYNAFKILKFTTQDMKLRWLQFRILHHILTTNRSVAKFNKNQDPRCTFCGAHSETIIHLMWECANVQNFWTDRKCSHSHEFSFTKDLVIFGISNTIKTDKICDLIVLLAKSYLYRTKAQHNTLGIKSFKTELFQRFQIEPIINKISIIFRMD